MYLACPPHILAPDQGLASTLCPGMLSRKEEPGLSGAGPCQVPVDGRPYLARWQWSWIGKSVQTWVWVSARADSRRENAVLMLTVHPKFKALEKRQGPSRNGDKKWPRIWFSQNNEENPTTSPRTMFESQPAPAHRTMPALVILSICICICMYNGKRLDKINLPFKNWFCNLFCKLKRVRHF